MSCHVAFILYHFVFFISCHVISSVPHHSIPLRGSTPFHSVPLSCSFVNSFVQSFRQFGLIELTFISIEFNSDPVIWSLRSVQPSPLNISILVFVHLALILFWISSPVSSCCFVSFIHSVSQSVSQSVIHSFIHTFIHSFIHSFVRSFVCSFIHSFGCRPGLPSHRHLAYCRCVATSLQRVWRTLTSKICPLIVCQVLCEKCHRPTTYPSHNPNRSLTPCTKFRPRHRHLSTTITNAATMKVKHQQTAIPCEALPNGLAADAQRSLC